MTMAAPNYSLMELMTVIAAREVADGEVVFAGTGLPMLGVMLAQQTHAPGCVIIFEAGTVASRLAHLPMSVGDPRAMKGAAVAAGLNEVFTFVLQAGRVDVGFLSGAQVDRYGNINSTSIGDDPRRPKVRFSGSGGACDIACLAGRLVVVMKHERRRFVERVRHVTSPGYGSGGRWRRDQGLPRGGPSAVITDKAVLRFHPETGEMVLTSVHPGVTPDEVRDLTGWDLRAGEHVEVTSPPTATDLEVTRRFDPEGFWSR
jgi:glutaconate CoA-transferase subunit B